MDKIISLSNNLIKILLSKWKLFLLIFFLILIYTFYVHEYAHYAVTKILGYNATINFSLTPHNSINPPISNKDHAFLVAMAPYMLDFIFLAILFGLFLKFRKSTYFYLSFIPLTNTLGNSPFINGPTDDFNALISHGISKFIVYPLSLLSIILFLLFIAFFRRNKAD